MKIVCRCFEDNSPGLANREERQECSSVRETMTLHLQAHYVSVTQFRPFKIYSIHFTEHISIPILVCRFLLDCCVHIFSLFFQSNETQTPNSYCP